MLLQSCTVYALPVWEEEGQAVEILLTSPAFKKVEKFKYLRPVFQSNGDINADVSLQNQGRPDKMEAG